MLSRAVVGLMLVFALVIVVAVAVGRAVGAPIDSVMITRDTPNLILSSGAWQRASLPIVDTRLGVFITWSPDGSRIAYFEYMPDGKFQPRVVDVETGVATSIGTPGDYQRLYWSAAGDALHTLEENHASFGESYLVTLSIADGVKTTRRLDMNSNSNFADFHWPGGGRYAVVRTYLPNRHLLIDTQTGAITRTLSAELWYSTPLRLSDGASRLAWADIETEPQQTDPMTVRILDVPNGEIRSYPTPLTAISDLHWSPGAGWLLFRASAPGFQTTLQQDLFVMNARDGEITRLTNDAADESGFGWSVDGKSVFYLRNGRTTVEACSVTLDARRRDCRRIPNTTVMVYPRPGVR